VLKHEYVLAHVFAWMGICSFVDRMSLCAMNVQVFTVTVVDNILNRVSAISPMYSSIWNWAGWGTILQRYAR
jgi:hypothetical protein